MAELISSPPVGQGGLQPPPYITLSSWAILCDPRPSRTQRHSYHAGFSKGLQRLSAQELRAKIKHPPPTLDKVNLSLHTHITQSCMNCTTLTGMTCMCKHYDYTRFNSPELYRNVLLLMNCFCWLWPYLICTFGGQSFYSRCFGLEDILTASYSFLPMRIFAAALLGCTIVRTLPQLILLQTDHQCRLLLTIYSFQQKPFPPLWCTFQNVILNMHYFPRNVSQNIGICLDTCFLFPYYI